MTEALKPRLRCAVYTRKSHAEGLEQEYNSIDAQKDACHAYITSQRNEGWTPVNDDYDDAAYSGGNMDRPALQRLFQDIVTDKVDIIVIYKIDRLTRSLSDFSKMVDVFDKHNVSFAAVTQQINSASSMGRLMLNVLLSFAQFEREVTSERIRDKMAASKRKGLWMGGIPPLGYNLKDKHLTINDGEADIVRFIFANFIALGGATSQLVKLLKQHGYQSKAWQSKAGRTKPSKPIDKALIYKLLHNRVYLGEIGHKGQWHPGKHEAIIEKDAWDTAQQLLIQNQQTRGNQHRATVPFLLKGIVFSQDGNAMTTWSTVKKKTGKRYPLLPRHA